MFFTWKNRKRDVWLPLVQTVCQVVIIKHWFSLWLLVALRTIVIAQLSRYNSNSCRHWLPSPGKRKQVWISFTYFCVCLKEHLHVFLEGKPASKWEVLTRIVLLLRCPRFRLEDSLWSLTMLQTPKSSPLPSPHCLCTIFAAPRCWYFTATEGNLMAAQ